MLRWSFMLFVLAAVEGTLSHNGTGEGSALIAKISFALATMLFILFQFLQVHHTAHDPNIESPGR
jgi:uncharacterized membrane protein YtjA (UPF0391 family)